MPHHDSRNSSLKSRPAVRLNSTVEKKLLGYAALASATGVGVLALAQPSEAKVVYTAAHQTIAQGSTFQLDLNGDGINDFFFQNRFSAPGAGPTFSTRSGARRRTVPRFSNRISAGSV